MREIIAEAVGMSWMGAKGGLHMADTDPRAFADALARAIAQPVLQKIIDRAEERIGQIIAVAASM